jgi:hypothetical protein
VSAYVPVAMQREIRNRYGNCCAYCRTAESLAVATFEIEHITPRAAGGKTVFENLCLACPTCNRFKADRTVVPDPETQTLVPLFHPQLDAWDDHFTWSEDYTELVAQTPIGRATIAALRMNRPQLIRVRQLWAAMGEHPPILD